MGSPIGVPGFAPGAIIRASSKGNGPGVGIVFSVTSSLDSFRSTKKALKGPKTIAPGANPGTETPKMIKLRRSDRDL